MTKNKIDYLDYKGIIDFDLYWTAYNNYVYEGEKGGNNLLFAQFINDTVSEKYITEIKKLDRKIKIKEIFGVIE